MKGLIQNFWTWCRNRHGGSGITNVSSIYPCRPSNYSNFCHVVTQHKCQSSASIRNIPCAALQWTRGVWGMRHSFTKCMLAANHPDSSHFVGSLWVDEHFQKISDWSHHFITRCAEMGWRQAGWGRSGVAAILVNSCEYLVSDASSDASWDSLRIWRCISTSHWSCNNYNEKLSFRMNLILHDRLL